MSRVAKYNEARAATACDPMLSLKETAAACGCDVSTVRRYMKRGQLPFFQIGRGWVKVRKSTLDKFLSQYERKKANAS